LIAIDFCVVFAGNAHFVTLRTQIASARPMPALSNREHPDASSGG
jgi:hypothetical protein